MASVFLCSMEFTTQQAESGLFTHWITASDLATAETAMAAFVTSLGASTPFKALFPTNITWLTPKISEVDQATGVVIRTTFGTGGPIINTGSAASCMPAQLAVCVSLRSALAGKSQNGRYYLPSPIFSAYSSVALLTSTTQGVLTTALAAAHSAEISSDPSVTVVIYSRKLRALTTVLSLNVGNIPDVQRRRRNGQTEARVSVNI